MAVLDRIKMLDWSEPKRHSEDMWLVQQDAAVANAKVQWHCPEWVDFEGLNYSDHLRTRIFE